MKEKINRISIKNIMFVVVVVDTQNTVTTV